MDWYEYYFLLIGLSWAATGIYRWYAVSKGMLDHPNSRSSHTVPTPRGGGLVFTLSWFILLGVFYWLDFFAYETIEPFLPALIIVFIGIYDDRKGAPRWLRFLCQISAVFLCFWLIGESGETLQAYLPLNIPDWGYFILSILGCVWFTNLFNFMDGTDGFATIQALIIFGVGGWVFGHALSPDLSVMSWSLCAFLIGFLVWNWPKAKMFMGDSGSATLGLLVCIFAYVSNKNYHISPYLWLILSSPFWYDATATLIRRILARDKWHQPHRMHAYQRLVQLGWSHQKLLLWLLVVNVGCVVLVLNGVGHSNRWPLLFAADLVYLTVIYLIIEIRKPMYGSWYRK
jgi:Fuc2NAc and GlcNAc transferase